MFNPRVTKLFLALGFIVGLIACGGTSQPTAPVIHHFTATGTDAGDGSWEISWAAQGDAVRLNGMVVTASGSRIVTAASGPAVYVLSVDSANQSIERELTIAQPSEILVTGPAGTVSPFVIEPAASLQLNADVLAAGASVEPNDGVAWASSNPTVLAVSADGLVTAHGFGDAVITATSVQLSLLKTVVSVSVQPSAVQDFRTDEPEAMLEAGTSLNLRWQANWLDELVLNTFSEGAQTGTTVLDATAAEAQVQVPNAPDVNYQLSWTGQDGSSGMTSLWPEPQRVFGWVCSRADQEVLFDDPLVDSAVRAVYGLPATGPIECSDVQVELTSNVVNDQEENSAILLNRCGGPIRVDSLEGLQHLTHLLRLELECNEISDISRLASMTGLVELNLDNNMVADLSPLQNLTDLQVLGLYNNRVIQLEPLAGLEQLRILYLSWNQVKDVSPLAGLHALEHLWLFLNCTEISFEPEWVWSDCLQDLSALDGLTNLRSLVFHNNEVDSIDFLNSGMQQLQLVFATGNRISDAGPLAGLPQLSTVMIDDNLLTSLVPLVANVAFPSSAEPFEFNRGTVTMPPEPPFEGHLLMGYNCMDPADPEIAAQIQALSDRGATVIGAGANHKSCEGGGPTSLELQLHRQQLLETWRPAN